MNRTSERLRVIVSRDVSHETFGGRVGGYDHAMAYALGLRQLGHDVFFFEDVRSEFCRGADGKKVPFSRWPGRERFESLLGLYDLWPDAGIVVDEGRATYGMPYDRVLEVAKTADLLVNVQGRMKCKEILGAVAHRIYVDINPAKTQVYDAEYGIDRGFEDHDSFFTVGLNIGNEDCPIPTGDRTWHPVLPPVYLPMWPATPPSHDRFTTISGWAGKNTFRLKGQYSGQKSDAWRALMTLPSRASQRLEIALRAPGYEADVELLRSNGWFIRDARELDTLAAYRRYITESRGEFSAANERYVRFNTGWVSDRTARYLAAGKPAIVQSTGFEKAVPAGTGLLTFRSSDEALEQLERVDQDYRSHASAARRLAEEHFAADRVVAGMLEVVGLR